MFAGRRKEVSCVSALSAIFSRLKLFVCGWKLLKLEFAKAFESLIFRMKEHQLLLE
jgi:hypothetical protein